MRGRIEKQFAIRLCFSAAFVLCLTGCAAIFGWDIHAPGILSDDFYASVKPQNQRIALYLTPETVHFISKDRGGRTADPQTYHVGEAFAPMLVEAFQASFSEFIFLEAEPTQALLKQYGIPYLILVKITGFKNRVTWGAHGLSVTSETVVFNSELQKVGQFKSTGTSGAEKVFSKKGGPQVNLNAAIENNVKGIIQYLQDSIVEGDWENKKNEAAA